MTNDLESAKGAVSSNIINFARSLIMTVSTISMLFLLSYKLTIAVLSVMPFFTISTMFYTRFSKKYEKIG
jgi:ABC-type multidrug transport system fused ATPase/permease subunit